MKKFIILLFVAPLFFIGCENNCVDVVCDQGLAKEDANGLCFCDCLNGFTGEKCDQAPCEGICENNGTCVDGTCDCPDGFLGDNCETQDFCFGIACENGTLNITDNVCACDCYEGFTGEDCSVEIATLLIGNWNAVDMCQIYYMSDSIPYIPTIRQTAMGNYEVINFGAIDTTLYLPITIENDIITLPLTEAGEEYGSLLVEGSGVIAEGGDTIAWDYTTEYDVEVNGEIQRETDSCTGIWIKL